MNAEIDTEEKEKIEPMELDQESLTRTIFFAVGFIEELKIEKDKANKQLRGLLREYRERFGKKLEFEGKKYKIFGCGKSTTLHKAKKEREP